MSFTTHLELCSHLLMKPGELEQAAFLFATAAGDHFTVEDVWALSGDHFEKQTCDHLELHPHVWSEIVARAKRERRVIIEVHSHPQAKRAAFSRTDVQGMRETAHQIGWRLHEPYVALVLSQEEMDGLVWWPDSEAPEALVNVVVEQSNYPMSRRTLNNWSYYGTV